MISISNGRLAILVAIVVMIIYINYCNVTKNNDSSAPSELKKIKPYIQIHDGKSIEIIPLGSSYEPSFYVKTERGSASFNNQKDVATLLYQKNGESFDKIDTNVLGTYIGTITANGTSLKRSFVVIVIKVDEYISDAGTIEKDGKIVDDFGDKYTGDVSGTYNIKYNILKDGEAVEQTKVIEIPP